MRKRRNMTVAELADFVGTTSVHMTRLENGQRSLSLNWMKRISSALMCIPAELLPPEMYQPALTGAEQSLLAFYRSLDDECQIRLLKAFQAY
ncbi:MAG: helix-turn-helix transcriptional regulator, partial [Parvibaculum sp.]|nr:helix-turn-helix transcriptional regulator [Parvibaculum sp.]